MFTEMKHNLGLQMDQHYWPRNVYKAKLWFDRIITTTNEGDYYHELVKLRYKNWNEKDKPVE